MLDRPGPPHDPSHDRGEQATSGGPVHRQENTPILYAIAANYVAENPPVLRPLDDDEFNDTQTTYSPVQMAEAFVYREIIPDLSSYHDLESHLRKYRYVAEKLGFDSIPNHDTFRRTWQNRFSDTVRDRIEEYGSRLGEQLGDGHTPTFDTFARQFGPDVTPDPEDITGDQKKEAIRHIRPLVFDKLETDRAENASFHDNWFFDFQALISRETDFAQKQFDELHEDVEDSDGNERVPAPRTHFRAIQTVDAPEWAKQFEAVFEREIEAAKGAGIFENRNVTLAIDGTDRPFYPQTKDEDGNPDLPEGVVGTKKSSNTPYAYKHITVSAVTGERVLKLASFPLKDRSRLNIAVMYLLRRARKLVNIGEVLMDSEFRDIALLRWIDDQNIDFIVQYPRTDKIKPFLRTWNGGFGAAEYTIDPVGRDEELDVTLFGKRLDHGEPIYDTDQLELAEFGENEDDENAPSGRWMAYVTNKTVAEDTAEAESRRYAQRWGIETNYRVIKQCFLAKTTSRKFSVRTFFWLFAVMLYNAWVLLDAFLRADHPDLAPDDRPVMPAASFAKRFHEIDYG